MIAALLDTGAVPGLMDFVIASPQRSGGRSNPETKYWIASVLRTSQ
jgi:hypothetical protein